MRRLLTTLLTILGISCATANTLFDDDLREFIELVRLQMRCGYEPAGVPPLAPYQADFKAIKIQRDHWDIRANFSELTVTGLDEYDVRVLYYNNIFGKINFDFNFEKILAKGNYKMDLVTNEFGPSISIFGDGQMQLALNNVRVFGSFKLRPTIKNSVKIVGFIVKVEMDAPHSDFTGVHNSKFYSKIFNSWLEEFLQVLINDNPADVSAFLESLIVPPLNKAMKNLSLIELIALIVGYVRDFIPNEPFC